MDQPSVSSSPQPSRPPIVQRQKRAPLGGIILVVVGAVWLLQNLGYSWAKSIWLPLVLIVIGLYLVTKPRK